MSEPILAPEEVEALMATVAPSEHTEAVFASLPPVKQPEHVDAFHFDNADADKPEHYPMFVNLQERMVEMMDEDWDEVFKRDITIQMESMETSLYKDIIAVEDPMVYFVFEVEGYGRILLTFDSYIIVAFVDAMLGGDGEATDSPKTLSPVELRLSERIAEKMANMLSELWAPVHALAFKPYKLDYDPQFLAVTGAMEKCFSAHFDVKLTDDVITKMGIHYPRSFLEPMMDMLRVALSDDSSDTDDEWTGELMQSLAQTPAEIRFELGRCQVDIGTFLTLKPGDALPLTTRSSDPCSLWIENIPLFQARPGEQTGMLAAEIIKPVKPGGTL